MTPPPTARRRGIVTCLAATVLSAVVFTAQSGVSSGWRSQPVTVDGLTADWPTLQTIPRGPAVGALNDQEFLHLVVSSSDPAVGAPLLGGLIVWFDPSGGRAQTFGLRLPGVALPPLPGMNPVPTNTSAPGVITARTYDRFDVLGPGQNQRRLVDITLDLAIEVASGFSDQEVIYELKVPLVKTAARTWAVGAGPGTTIGLGIATPEAPRGRGSRQRLVGDDGFIGGHPFFGGGFASFREPDGRPKPVQIWTTLTLASKAP